MKIGTVVGALSLGVLLGCSGEPLTNTERGAVAGGAIGAGTGAVVGHQLGSTGAGAAIGGATGAATGAIVGQAQDRDHKGTVELQQEMLMRQELEIKRQDGEIEDLNRQKYHNDSIRRFQKPTATPPDGN